MTPSFEYTGDRLDRGQCRALRPSTLKLVLAHSILKPFHLGFEVGDENFETDLAGASPGLLELALRDRDPGTGSQRG